MTFTQINTYLGSGSYRYDNLQGREVDAFFMYQDIFNYGEDLQDKSVSFYSSNNKYILICVRIPKDRDNEKVKQVIIHKNLNELKNIINSDDMYFNILSCISYCGHSKNKKNARYMYALVLDLDCIIANYKNVEDYGLTLLDGYIRVNRLLIPNYIVSSGHGIHLYYIFKEPVPMYKENIELLYNLKKGIVDSIWTEDISAVSKQYGDIVQGFRVGGTYTKDWKNKTKCFYFTDERYTLNDLAKNCAYIKLEEKKKYFNLSNHIDIDRQHITLEVAKKKYPEWYENRIIKKQPPKNKTNCKKWDINVGLYNWWLNKIYEVSVGHRYWYCYMIMVYGIKCSIDKNIIIKDIDKAYKFFNNLNDENPFTKQDIKDVLRNFRENQFLWKRKTIEENTGITIPPNKRNGLPRELHLEIARHILEIKSKQNGKALQGRKPKNNVDNIYDYIIQESDKEKDIAQKFNISVRQARRYKKKLREL